MTLTRHEVEVSGNGTVTTQSVVTGRVAAVFLVHGDTPLDVGASVLVEAPGRVILDVLAIGSATEWYPVGQACEVDGSLLVDGGGAPVTVPLVLVIDRLSVTVTGSGAGESATLHVIVEQG